MKAKFAKHLRDQIEDCAKVGDQHAKELRQQTADSMYMRGKAEEAEALADQIRALAGPTTISTEERKEIER